MLSDVWYQTFKICFLQINGTVLGGLSYLLNSVYVVVAVYVLLCSNVAMYVGVFVCFALC